MFYKAVISSGFFSNSEFTCLKGGEGKKKLKMGRKGLLDLEKQYAFYKSYHRDPVNVLLHRLFVWPVVFTFLVLLYFTPCVSQFQAFRFLPHHFLTSHGLFLNLGFLLVLLFVVIDLCLDKRAGSLAALLCMACWVGSSFLARSLGFSWAWKVRLILFSSYLSRNN